MNHLSRSAIVLFAVATWSPAAIVLTDASFENNNIGANTFQQNGASVAWPGGTSTQSTYLLDNTNNATWFDTATPNGTQSLSLANGYITQQLNDNVNGAVLTDGLSQQFDISFYAARRLGGTGTGAGTFSLILQKYSGNTYLGDLAVQKFNLLGDDANASTIDLNLAAGQWSNQINISLTTTTNLSAGSNIRLVFAANGSPYGDGAGNREAAVDNISIAQVPEPSTALLGGLGLVSLLRRRRA